MKAFFHQIRVVSLHPQLNYVLYTINERHEYASCHYHIIVKNIIFIALAGSAQRVLGANDGIISVTSLIMGMAASGASSHTLLITCVAGLISGASSMAAGEYISVKSQVDIEEADLHMEAKELEKIRTMN